MQYSFAALLALAGSAIAQTVGYHALTQPTSHEALTAGQPFTLVWTSGSPAGPVNFVLTGGSDYASLQEIGTVGTNIDSTLGQWVWNVASDLGSLPAYGLKIVLASDPSIYQWSNPFTITPVKAEQKKDDTPATYGVWTPPTWSSTPPTAPATTPPAAPAPSTWVASSVHSWTTESPHTSTWAPSVPLTTGVPHTEAPPNTWAVPPYATAPVHANGTTPAVPVATGDSTILTQTSNSPKPTAATTTPAAPPSTGAADSLGFSAAVLVGGLFVAVSL